MKNISYEVVEKLETHFYVPNIFVENRAVSEIMWKSTIERSRPQMTIWRMYITCWIPKATDTLTGCVTLIAFPL
jgi:hypothetical protein